MVMVVSIKSSSIVKPDQPTPNVKLWLSECDQIKPYTHAPVFYIYSPEQTHNSISSSFETLKISLSHILVPYYPLAGRLNWIGGGRFELVCNGIGAVIVEAESESKIEDLGDFCPTPETKKLLPFVDYTKDITELPLLLVQLTRFKCGGISIGVAVSHIVLDGRGTFEFITSWGNFARGEKNLVVEPYHDRSKVFYKGDPMAKPRFDHLDELTTCPTLIGHDNTDEERNKECTNRILKLSKTHVDKLRELTNEGRDATTHQYSRYEAVAAHIWRCLSKARKHQNVQLTSLRIPLDCRKRFKPSLPSGYYGNAVMVPSPIAQVGKLSLGLGDVCWIISEGAGKFNDDYLKSSIDFLASQEDLSPWRTGFHTDSNTGRFIGNPNITITSWLGLPVYGADFGWGKPIFMGPAGMGFDGKSYVIPGRDEDGSFVIPIRLQVTHMDDFVKLFYQDIPIRRALL